MRNTKNKERELRVVACMKQNGCDRSTAESHVDKFMEDVCEDCGCKLNGSGAETRTGFICEECFEEAVEL